MAEYVIEYKSTEYPYNYRFVKYKGTDEVARFSNLYNTRKTCIDFIRTGIAILCAVRGKGVEQLIYQSRHPDIFVVENRRSGRWYVLKRDGSLGKEVGSDVWLSLRMSAY